MRSPTGGGCSGGCTTIAGSAARRDPLNACQPTICSTGSPSSPSCRNGVGRFSQYFPADAIAELRRHDLDVLLRFGFGILRGEVLDVARYGIWSFHHDDERVIRGGPPSFWEVDDGLATTGVLFQRLTDKLDAGVPLARATFRTVGYSYPRNRDRAALGAAVLPAKFARAVRQGIVEPDSLPVADASAVIRRDPGNGQMARFLARQSVRAVSARDAVSPSAPSGASASPRTPGRPHRSASCQRSSGCPSAARATTPIRSLPRVTV